MPPTQRKASLKVFDAIAAPQRLQILRVVYTRGPLSYVDVMNQLNLSPSRDAGKFAYHLRTLRQAGLLEADKTTKKYGLTSLGTIVIDFYQNVDEHTLRDKGRLLVRTSRLAMEEFDRNKIVQALNREAGVPIDLGHKIAEETEERLLRLDTLYLTAPLIREFVNSVLIEKGLHEYRHKLTRLGLPVYDVAQLIKKAESSEIEAEWIDRIMGKNVMTEYVLLDAFPREIADEHLCGKLHLTNIDTWVLKPDSFQHDLRVFLQEGYRPSKATSMIATLKRPNTFEDALTITSAILHSSGIEVVEEQGINHFNLFLAPFAKNVHPDVLKGALKRFLFTLNQGISNRTSADISLGIDFSVPRSLENVKAIGLDGKISGTYGEYLDESLKILDVLLELMVEEDTLKPLFQPHLILNLATSDLRELAVEPLLLKAHALAAKYGTLYFANLAPEWQKDAAYFATGIRLAPDWTGDWELDTMRTGNLGTVVVNLPMLVYGAKNNENKFFSDLDSCLETAVEAIKIRYSTIKERVDRFLLPFISQRITEENYFRVKNASLIIGFVGLNEAVKATTGKQLFEDRRTTDYAVKIIGHFALAVKKLSWKYNLRISASQSIDFESPQRLAELDVERSGWGTVFTQGTRSSPYYTDSVTVPLEANIPLNERLRIESSFHPLLGG
ncbi:MAG: anaerobic ribonucleoside-triphosphate reductase, partial [Candidatus Bathyarchaeota archaeon]